MTYSRREFEDGKCPHCGSGDISKKHNRMNMAVAKGVGYFFDFPFDRNYKCKRCGANNSEKCFIATAVYGDKDAPEVETLRQYRDNVLMQSTPGRAIVDFYYSGAGKKAADFIKENMPGAIPTIRKGLDLLVENYSRQKREVNDNGD
jgi:hypothetical protein